MDLDSKIRIFRFMPQQSNMPNAEISLKQQSPEVFRRIRPAKICTANPAITVTM
jgi:hypothetical protein